MNAGKTLFAQLMEFVPWSSFARSVARYGGDRRARALSCAEQYRAMAFAQLTYRESLRDLETCLSVQPSKLYGLGFRQPVRRATLADANEGRDWRIYADLAQRLIAQARPLYEAAMRLTDRQQESPSFLKKRSKRLLPIGTRVAATRTYEYQKFFGSFFQKRTAFLPACAAPLHPSRKRVILYPGWYYMPAATSAWTWQTRSTRLIQRP